MSDLTIESASDEQIDSIGELLLETGSEVLEYIYDGKDNAVRHLENHWDMNEGLFSHRHAFLAKNDAKNDECVLGLELGYTVAQKAQRSKATAARLIADLGETHFKAQMNRVREVETMFPKVPDDAYYLQFLVVRPEVRGTGSGRALLHHAFDRARANGLASVHLDVISNKPAVQFYLANGMVDAAEIRIPSLVRSHDMPGMIRMVMAL